jgi:hypothetical protein
MTQTLRLTGQCKLLHLRKSMIKILINITHMTINQDQTVNMVVTVVG